MKFTSKQLEKMSKKAEKDQHKEEASRHPESWHVCEAPFTAVLIPGRIRIRIDLRLV